jgi:hypothetical protein
MLLTLLVRNGGDTESLSEASHLSTVRATRDFAFWQWAGSR